MSVSPFDHPVLGGLLGDEEVSRFFSAEAEMQAMLEFEIALAGAEAAEGVVAEEAGAAIAKALGGFEPDLERLREGTARDGVVVPELVKQLRAVVGEPHGSSVHFGATSQDVIDTGLALRMVRITTLLEQRLDGIVAFLAELEERDGSREVMAHTRMQAAIAVPASRKIASWRQPLERHLDRFGPVRAEVAVLQFGGAAGTLEKLGERAAAVTERLAKALGLRAVSQARHSERDGITGFASWLSLVTGSLGKMGQDIALMAQSEVGEIRLATGGGSSAMPHKVNPVGAETLVALARFNATLVSGMHQSMVHENERSGAAWTLEWLILPQMVVATAAALRCAEALLRGLSFTDAR
ncbi:3-carboxy-cis,cis-muconate cycloisomerase [Mesorhizobium sp. CAU 1741]|uniref:3-carboxy-cis,cis-muconate cycloisomerase n=1 Tax=Mesorhizobium sp. CAU 1741 TaxID=3140366 RepID=UPI00325B473F